MMDDSKEVDSVRSRRNKKVNTILGGEVHEDGDAELDGGDSVLSYDNAMIDMFQIQSSKMYQAYPPHQNRRYFT